MGVQSIWSPYHSLICGHLISRVIGIDLEVGSGEGDNFASPQGTFGGIWRLSVATLGRMLLASSGERLRMLPNPVQCRGRLRDEEWPGPDVTKPLTSRWLLAGGAVWRRAVCAVAVAMSW